MTAASKPKSPGAKRAAAYRERMRAQGLRPIQLWVPDVRSPEFIAEARRQSLIMAESDRNSDDQAFIDSLFEWPDE